MLDMRGGRLIRQLLRRSGQLEQRQRLDDTSQRTALFEVFSCIGAKERVDPIVTVLDNVVAEHLVDMLECFFGLLACLSLRTIVRGTIGDVSLHFRPQKFDRLYLRAEWRRVNERVPDIIEQLLDDGAIVIGKFF